MYFLFWTFKNASESGSIDLQSLFNNNKLNVALGSGTAETANSGGSSSLFNGFSTLTQESFNFVLDAGDSNDIEMFTLKRTSPFYVHSRIDLDISEYEKIIYQTHNLEIFRKCCRETHGLYRYVPPGIGLRIIE